MGLGMEGVKNVWGFFTIFLGEGQSIKMKGGFEGPRISPAEFLLERPKRNQKAAGTAWFRSSCYSSWFLEGLHHPWSFDWQLYEASEGDRRFTSM